jgi:hypothetical protein
VESRFYDLARATLDTIVAGWPADPTDALALPDRQYVAFGLVAWDCEQLTVSGIRSYAIEADPAQETSISGVVFYNRAVEIAVSLIRCVPDVDVSGDTIIDPTPDAIEAAAQAAFTDQETIMDVLVAAQQARELATFGGLSFGNWTAEGPQGGFGGGTLHVRLTGF